MLAKKMSENKFSLVISLPKNDLEFAEAAMKAGADAIKVHINVFHYASNQKYGSFDEQVEFLTELSKLSKKYNKLIGIVPGDDTGYASEEDFEKLNKLGFDFVSTYVDFAPVSLLTHKYFDVCAALSYTTDTTAEALDKVGVDIIEASLVKQSEYRNPLSILDLSKYASVVSKTNKPVLVPTQKKIKPSEIQSLYNVGCKGIMCGAVVFDEDDVNSFASTIASFREAIELL